MTATTKVTIATTMAASLFCSLLPDAFGAGGPAATEGGDAHAAPLSSDALSHNKRGIEYGSKGKWAQAVIEHEFAVDRDPWNLAFSHDLSVAYLRLGEQLLTKKDYKGAISKFRFAIYIDPENQAADKCLSTAWKASGKVSNDFKARRKEAERLEADGDYVEAIAEYRHCARMSDCGMAHYRLGCVLLKQGTTVPIKTVEGYKELRTAVTKPWQPDEKSDLSRCHAKLGDILSDFANLAREHGNTEASQKRFLNAGIEYRRAVTIDPHNINALRGLLQVSKAEVQINPSFDNHLMLAGAYQLMGDEEHAKQEYYECYKLDHEKAKPMHKEERKEWLKNWIRQTEPKKPIDPPMLFSRIEV